MLLFATPAARVSRAPRASAAVQRVRNPADFAAALPSAAAAARLVVFSFTADNCRACRYASRGFQRVAEEFEPREEVAFFEMDVLARENQRLCRDMGVAAVPMVRFYRFLPGVDADVGCLDEVVVGPRNVAKKVRERCEEFAGEAFDIEQYVFEAEA